MRGVLALSVVVGTVLGCTSAIPPSPTPGQPVAITDAGECRRLIEATRLADPATILNVDACRYTAAGEEASRQVLSTAGASADQLWAALWVYAASGGDPAPLAPFATHADPTLRAMAAATLVAFGDESGFAPLSGLLLEATTMSGSRPPLLLSSYAANTLFRYVVADGVPVLQDDGDSVAQASAWQAWLEQNGGALQFSAADGVWTLP